MKNLRVKLLLSLLALWLGASAVLFGVFGYHPMRAGGGPPVRHGEAIAERGYAFVEASAPGSPVPLRGELWVAVAALTAALALSYGAATLFVFRPLKRISRTLQGLFGGDAHAGAPFAPSNDLEELASAIEAAGRREAALWNEISSIASHLRDRGVQAQAAVGRVREGLDLGREAAQVVGSSLEQLGRTVEETHNSFGTIATSTSDNSSSLMEMSASVDEVARNADELAEHVTNTATSVFQMVRSIGEVADRVEVLARETDTTASSMAQIDASTRQIEENAREAAELSGRMAEAAREGSLAVQETLQGIHASHEVMRETVRSMGELGVASKAIDGVVKIINDINDKTKLLSLNAAIIAAQAGEHGKSFAVVAHEIKNLSDRTASSTSEISRIVRGIRDRMGAATEAVGRGQRETGRSVELAERAGQTLEKILSTAQISHDMTREILRGTEEQSRGSESVMTSMEEVSTMVAYIRQAAGEHRASGEKVTESAAVMRKLTELVNLSTAEQAEVGRYLSEAIAAVDQNLQNLLEVVDRGKDEMRSILGHLGRLKMSRGDHDTGVREVEGAIAELQRHIRTVEVRIAALAGPASGTA